MELTPQSGARSDFVRLNTSHVALNDPKPAFGENSTERAYRNGIRPEGEMLPSQNIEVTQEVRIQHSDRKEARVQSRQNLI